MFWFLVMSYIYYYFLFVMGYYVYGYIGLDECYVICRQVTILFNGSAIYKIVIVHLPIQPLVLQRLVPHKAPPRNPLRALQVLTPLLQNQRLHPPQSQHLLLPVNHQRLELPPHNLQQVSSYLQNLPFIYDFNIHCPDRMERCGLLKDVEVS